MHLLLVRRCGSHEEVEVILQQAVGARIGDGLHMPGVPLHEEEIVASLAKDALAPVAAIEDVVIEPHLQGRWTGHEMTPSQDPEIRTASDDRATLLSQGEAHASTVGGRPRITGAGQEVRRT